jgi:2,3-bisphosphoglycerate-independent phosphoglycerate mutase
MQDFTAGHITSDEARLLLDDLQREVGTGYLEFVPGVSYRNLLLLRGQRHPPPFTGETRTIPPHDLTGKSVCDAYPRGPGSDLLAGLMDQSVEVFAEHPVNRQRALSGKPPATGIWLWGLGQSPQLDSFVSRYQVQGTMITAVDLLRGVARLIGWDCLDVPGATGYADTDYDAKGRAAVGALATCDLVCVHIEAPDEASHEGDTRVKVESLERIDSKVVRPLLHALRELGDFRLLVSPDHPTLLRTKTHSHGAVPWVMCGTGIHADAATTYDEASARDSRLRFDRGHELMGFFLGRTGNRQD